LQDAVLAAASGDSILIGPGAYPELHQVVDVFGRITEICAYWTENKNLSLIGAGADKVTIGPEELGFLYQPTGVLYEGDFRNTVFVSGVRFRNLFRGVYVRGSLQVEDCVFEGAGHGVGGGSGDRCWVKRCEFMNAGSSVGLQLCNSVEVSDCSLSGRVFLQNVLEFSIRDCSASGNEFARFFRSSGVVEDNVGNCLNADCVSAEGGSVVELRRNTLRGGYRSLHAADEETIVTLSENLFTGATLEVLGLAFGAVIEGSGNDFIKANDLDSYLVRCAMYPETEPLARISLEDNYWGNDSGVGYVTPIQIGRFVWDHRDDPGLMVEVDYEPFSTVSVPTQIKSFGGVKSMFR
jgi:hypothetical protein